MHTLCMMQDTPTAAIAAQPTTAGYLTMARHALPSVPPPIDSEESDRYITTTLQQVLHSEPCRLQNLATPS